MMNTNLVGNFSNGLVLTPPTIGANSKVCSLLLGADSNVCSLLLDADSKQA